MGVRGRHGCHSVLEQKIILKTEESVLNIKFIRENPETVKWACKVKGVDDHVDDIIALDARVRELKTITEAKTAAKNKISREMPGAENKKELIAESKKISDEIAVDAAELDAKEAVLRDLLLNVPQIPSKDAPIGADDSGNIEIRRVGEPRKFDFEPRGQCDLMDGNNWWDAAKIGEICGSRTYNLRGELAELDLAVQTYVLQKLIKKGFAYMQVPAITKPQAVFDAGHFRGSDISVMKGDVFMLEGTDRCLAGTCEIVLNSIHQNEILDESALPVLYAGYSPCFRKEAGSAGRDTRGLIRVHQFHKVEQYAYCRPEQQEEMFGFLLGNACEVMDDFELPYRILEACTGDMGFNKIKMQDVEAWVPSENKYRELGSCSMIGDFQARRTNTRYRAADGTVRFCATLNNTGIALPRVLVPLMENHQNQDGSVNIPAALRPLMGGRAKIGGAFFDKWQNMEYNRPIKAA
ncbi:MAG: serine--tRNA ligase [Rickettsiales bacterium]|jgi:seryl-tRNA synthetase|nr:serine--tRNA ligase [Rickettsiales bacterium]